MNKLDISISQRTQLVMSYAMEQAFTVLTLPILELRTWLQEQIESNPLLILTPAEELSLPLYEDLIPSPAIDEGIIELHCAIPQRDLPLAEYLLFDVDPQGVLLESIEQIATQFGTSPAKVRMVIERVRSILPPHLCSETTKEALLRKLLSVKSEYADLFDDVYDDLLKKRYAPVLKRWNISFDTLKQLIKTSLMSKEPQSDLSSTAIFPDIVLYEQCDEFSIDDRSSLLPTFSINSEYVELAKDDQQFIRRYTAQAKWLDRIVSRRSKILTHAAQEIAKIQEAYLRGEASTISPLKTVDVCTTIQCHESTLARALSNKYIETPLGTYALRRFFTGHTPFHIEHLLSEAISKESKENPFSDEQLSTLINNQGIPCARRTIAKYRNTLGIPRASLRRRY